VENQHGLNSFLSFGAKSVNPEILETLLVGRKKIVDQLENRVKNIAKDGLNHQVLILGARGTGKTHILRVLYFRLQSFITQKKIKVAYFAEEEYGISGYLDFMVRILTAFIRWNDKDAEFLKEQLSVLQETPSSHQEETIKRIIREYIGNKPLLILAENFNDILDVLKTEGQSKLRNWLQENDRISIIATSQALSNDIGKEDKPFYGFFDEIHLKKLNLKESFELLKSLAKIDKREDVIKHLENKGNSQVKAINSLVKGNHRLLITFYEFLKSDFLSNLSVMFIKTLNDLKPYYETYIRYLPPQQQKIVRFLALAKTPQKGTNIARECFIEQKSLSKQLSELSRKKLIEIIVDPEDKRNKIYDIAEPLLRISIEIGEQKEGISALFIDFLAIYYNQDELLKQKIRFSEIYENCLDPKEKQLYNFEISARESAINIQHQISKNLKDGNNLRFKVVFDFLKKKDFQKALLILQDIPKINRDDNYYFMLFIAYWIKEDFNKAKEAVLKAIDIEPNSGVYWRGLGSIYGRLKEFDNSINALKKSFELNPKDENTLKLLVDVYLTLKEYKEVEKFLEKLLKINPNNEIALVHLGFTLQKLKKLKKSIAFLKKAIEINSNSKAAWVRLLFAYSSLGYHEKSIETSKKIIELDPHNIWPYRFLSLSYMITNQIKKGINVSYKLISLSKNFSNDKEHIISGVSDSILVILKNDKNINIEKCLKIETLISKEYRNQKEFKIPHILLETFRKVVLEKNEKVLYNLPKEQREFLQKEIIDFRKKKLE